MYKGRFFMREIIYECGDYLDGEIYPVFQAPGKRRKKCKPSSEILARSNQRRAEKRITRIAHANFSREDVALHLTYSQEPESLEEAKRDLQNFLRRVKRARRKAGLLDLKYISCTELGKKRGRVHHHLIINGGLDRDTLEGLWGKGYANSKRLQFNENGITGLTRYMGKDRLTYKRWNQSRNLILPQPKILDGSVSLVAADELAEAIDAGTEAAWMEERFPGWNLVEAKAWLNEVNRGRYIVYDLARAASETVKKGRREKARFKIKKEVESGD